MSQASQNFNDQGIVVESLIAEVALLIGDAVFILPATGRASKTLVAGDYASEVGFVVGGRRTYGTILQNDLDIGEQAAAAGEEVLVAVGGVVKTLADAVIATAGLRIAAGTATTAGRIKTAVATNFPMGVNLNSAGAAGAIVRVLIKHSTTAMV